MSRSTWSPIPRAVGGMNCQSPAAPTQLTARGLYQLSTMGRKAKLAGRPAALSSASTMSRYRPLLARLARKREASRFWNDSIHACTLGSISAVRAQGEPRMGSTEMDSVMGCGATGLLWGPGLGTWTGAWTGGGVPVVGTPVVGAPVVGAPVVGSGEGVGSPGLWTPTKDPHPVRIPKRAVTKTPRNNAAGNRGARCGEPIRSFTPGKLSSETLFSLAIPAKRPVGLDGARAGEVVQEIPSHGQALKEPLRGRTPLAQRLLSYRV